MSSTDPYGQGPQQSQTPYAPQSSQPQYAPQYPNAQQSYPQHPHQFQQQQSATQFAQPGFAQARVPQGKLNILGVISLALIAVSTIFNIFTPLLYRLLDSIDFASIGTVITSINAVLHLAAAGLALAGLLKKDAPRLRWTAITSLVMCGFWLFSTIGFWLVSLVPYSY